MKIDILEIKNFEFINYFLKIEESKENIFDEKEINFYNSKFITFTILNYIKRYNLKLGIKLTKNNLDKKISYDLTKKLIKDRLNYFYKLGIYEYFFY